MFAEISAAVKDVELNGHPTQRLPHNLNISFKGIRSKPFIQSLKNIAISAGSACNAANTKPSHVVGALGFDEERAYSSLRYSLGRFTTEEEVDYAISTTIKMNRLLKRFF
jgi:cysteine desulfurase